MNDHETFTINYRLTSMENAIKELAVNQIKQHDLLEAVHTTNKLMTQSHDDFVRRYEQDRIEIIKNVDKVDHLWDHRTEQKGAMKFATIGWSAIGGGALVGGLVVAILQLMKTH